MSPEIKLSQLRPGKTARILCLEGESETNTRLTELGFYPGQSVEALFSAPSGDPVAYLVQGTVIALRAAQAEKIAVIRS